MLHSDYHETYEPNFFNRADGIGNWQLGQMRYGDALCVMAYAMGLKSYVDVQKLFGFADGRVTDNTTAIEQMNKLIFAQMRWPKSVLDIGGGRGEVACAFSYAGARVQVVEPHVDAARWLENTKTKLFGNYRGFDIELINTTCPECLDEIDFSDVDTITFVESLEHIPENCFQPVWEKCNETLVRNHGMLVCANWLDYHPLTVSGREHCRLVDDAFYDCLAKNGTTVFRQGSHLVVQF